MKDEPAFPGAVVGLPESLQRPGKRTMTSSGLTKREYFAAMAMQGITSDHESLSTIFKHYGNTYDGTAMDAVAFADALIKQLESDE